MMTLEYLTSPEPLSCGHHATPEGVWWEIGPGYSGTACFTCALTAERLGHKVTMIPTNEQIATWLDWEREGIGTD